MKNDNSDWAALWVWGQACTVGLSGLLDVWVCSMLQQQLQAACVSLGLPAHSQVYCCHPFTTHQVGACASWKQQLHRSAKECELLWRDTLDVDLLTSRCASRSLSGKGMSGHCKRTYYLGSPFFTAWQSWLSRRDVFRSIATVFRTRLVY